MNDSIDLNEGVWFVYDGDCQICTTAALALRIKEDYGVLHTVNAREASEHPLLQRIDEEQLDLDEGMVIYHTGQFYHGPTALQFMAQYGESEGIFNRLNKTLFKSKSISKALYPSMRGVRNLLLKLRNVGPIDNLNSSDTPIFQHIFGESWEALPKVIKKHYANRPYSKDRVTVEAIMDVEATGPMQYLKPLFVLLGGIPPYTESQVPVTVHFDSEENTKAFQFNRTFKFKQRKPYQFRSRMIQIKDNEVIEIMRFGVCWRMTYHWENDKVVLRHKGYALKLFNLYITVPLTLIIGEGYAEETAIDDNTFAMFVQISHPLWGKYYSYRGQFAVVAP